MTLQTILKNKKKIIPVLKEYSKKIKYIKIKEEVKGMDVNEV